MADDPTNRGPQDRARINLSEDYELRYWSYKWGVSVNEVKTAVTEVGPSTDAVARQLGKQA